MTSEVLVLATSAGLFAIGAAGLLVHRHPVAMLMAIEVMLNAANLLIVLAAGCGAVDAARLR
jgi:NADH:ubiquinone oxidoreductase subunit K